MKNLSVTIVIPNWNGEHLLQSHLPGVIGASNNAEIIVVDDGSSDSSVHLISSQFPNVTLIQKKHHEGFSSAVNAGVLAATGDIIVLLNSDVEPEKDFLQPLLDHFSDASVFAIGCLDKSIEKNKEVLRGRGKAGWRKGFFIHDRGEVDKKTTAWVSGGSGAFRKSIWQKLRGMDTLFNPFYWEDIDLSYRALKAGYRLIFEPKSIVRHYHEQGKIYREFPQWYVQMVAYRNQYQFIWKNMTDPAIILALMLYTPLAIVKVLVRLDITMIGGYVAALIRLPWIIAHRIRTQASRTKTDASLQSMLQ